MRHPTPDGSKLIHASLNINGGLVMLSDHFPEMMGGKCRDPKSLGGSPVTLQLNVPDVDAVWKRAVEAGSGSIHRGQSLLYPLSLVVLLSDPPEPGGDTKGILSPPPSCI